MNKLLSLAESARIASELVSEQLKTNLNERQRANFEHLGACGVGFFLDNSASRSRLSAEQIQSMQQRGLIGPGVSAPEEGARISLVAHCVWQLGDENAYLDLAESGLLDSHSRAGNILLDVIVFRDTGQAIANWHVDNFSTDDESLSTSFSDDKR